MESGRPILQYQDKNIFDFIKNILKSLNLLSKDRYQSDEQAKAIFDNPSYVLEIAKTPDQEKILLNLKLQLNLFKICRENPLSINKSKLNVELKNILEYERMEDEKFDKMLKQLAVDDDCSEIATVFGFPDENYRCNIREIKKNKESKSLVKLDFNNLFARPLLSTGTPPNSPVLPNTHQDFQTSDSEESCSSDETCENLSESSDDEIAQIKQVEQTEVEQTENEILPVVKRRRF